MVNHFGSFFLFFFYYFFYLVCIPFFLMSQRGLLSEKYNFFEEKDHYWGQDLKVWGALDWCHLQPCGYWWCLKSASWSEQARSVSGRACSVPCTMYWREHYAGARIHTYDSKQYLREMRWERGGRLDNKSNANANNKRQLAPEVEQVRRFDFSKEKDHERWNRFGQVYEFVCEL